MHRRSALGLIASSTAACAHPGGTRPPATRASPPRAALREREDPGGRELFAAAQVEGVFVLRSLATEEQIVTDTALAGSRDVPASTFKVPNALIALEQGVLDGADATLPWDGVKRERPAWNRDATLASGMRDSTVWFFQEVARRIGAPAMQASLRAFDYGNADIGGGIDQFWLSGQLRISAREQVAFMAKLHRRELPVARAHQELVEHLTTRAQQPGWSWRGKTGLGDREDLGVGWLTGLCERDGEVFAYAMMMRAKAAEIERMIPLRPQLTYALLAKYGVLPPEAEPR